MPNRAKTPQEKKALSLEKDCRPCYGQNDKAARRLIPLHKAKEHRKARHRSNQDIKVFERLGEEAADLAESSARQDIHSVGGWTKGPDRRLGDIVREIPDIRDATYGARIRRRAKQAELTARWKAQLNAVPETAP